MGIVTGGVLKSDTSNGVLDTCTGIESEMVVGTGGVADIDDWNDVHVGEVSTTLSESLSGKGVPDVLLDFLL